MGNLYAKYNVNKHQKLEIFAHKEMERIACDMISYIMSDPELRSEYCNSYHGENPVFKYSGLENPLTGDIGVILTTDDLHWFCRLFPSSLGIIYRSIYDRINFTKQGNYANRESYVCNIDVVEVKYSITTVQVLKVVCHNRNHLLQFFQDFNPRVTPAASGSEVTHKEMKALLKGSSNHV